MAKSLSLFNLSFNLCLTKNFFLFIILISLSHIPKLNCDGCSSTSKIKKGDDCFNGIIHLIGRCGQFNLRKDGVLIVEYSDGSHRLFFGLKPMKEGHFPTKIH